MGIPYITKPLSTSPASQEAELSPQSAKEIKVHGWLRSLDNGRGVLLEYFPVLRDEFDADLSQIAMVRLSTPRSAGIVGYVNPAFWERCGVQTTGHRLLLAKGIKSLTLAPSTNIVT